MSYRSSNNYSPFNQVSRHQFIKSSSIDQTRRIYFRAIEFNILSNLTTDRALKRHHHDVDHESSDDCDGRPSRCYLPSCLRVGYRRLDSLFILESLTSKIFIQDAFLHYCRCRPLCRSCLCSWQPRSRPRDCYERSSVPVHQQRFDSLRGQDQVPWSQSMRCSKTQRCYYSINK